MESLAALRQSSSLEYDPRVQLLLADDDAFLRSLMASRARGIVEALSVLEAEDGAEAVQIGLQQRPQIALLDVNMPRLGGIEVAITLRELQPQMRVALQTADPFAHRDGARAQGLPLFDKLELDRVLGWLELQAQSSAEVRGRPGPLQKDSLQCSACGYGIVRSRPPGRCPMCQGEGTWIHTPWRPFGRGAPPTT
jgi:CheY-like chemotaxis protein